MRTHMSHDIELFLNQYWQDIGTPLAKKLQWHLANRDFDGMRRYLDNDYSGITDPIRLLKARCCVDIIKKADYLPTSDDIVQNAIVKWVGAECRCRDTNRKIRLVAMNHSDCDPLLARWLPKIRTVMRRFLGPIPDLENVFGGFGPGATLSNTRSQASALYKLQADTPSLTEGAVWFLPALPPRLQKLWFGEGKALNVVEAGRLQLVPKTYKTNRPIMVEPLVNAAIQRFFGQHLRKRLLHLGIDMSVAPTLHRQLACEGSKDGVWSTIDLSAASDTISHELVKAILPEEWYRCLNQARTPRIDIGEYRYGTLGEDFRLGGIYDDIYELEKFSSMGNGFTFELETMIFLAICTAVAGRRSVAGVFGDDIIIEDKVVDHVLPVLEACGFVINMDKSFWGLPYFRESCGGDYLHGVSVKGVTLKTEPICPMDWMELHNRLWILQEEHPCLDLARTLNFCRNQVPKRYRLGIPARLGIGGFFSYENYLHPKTKDGIHYFKCLIPQAKYLREWETLFDPDVILAALLIRSIPTEDAGVIDENVCLLRKNGYPLGPVKLQRYPGYRIAWVPCS